MYPVQRETPCAESVLRKVLCQDIPELTVCCVKASSGAFMFNRGGTVEFILHPQCKSFCVGDEAFFINAECRVQNAEWREKLREKGNGIPPDL